MGKRIKELKLKCPETHKREATKMPSRGEMSGQDWNTVAFGNKRPQSGAVGLKEAQRSGQVEGKCRQQLSSAPKDLKLAIMKARQAKQLTQKQLAQMLNMPPNVIAEYENGKAIPKNAEIAKIERTLNCKLPRVKK